MLTRPAPSKCLEAIAETLVDCQSELEFQLAKNHQDSDLSADIRMKIVSLLAQVAKLQAIVTAEG